MLRPPVYPGEPRFGRALDEAPAAVVEEEPDLVERAGRGEHDVDVAVAVEVVGDDAPGVADHVEAERRGHLRETSGVELRVEAAYRHLPRSGDGLTERQRGDGEQPARVPVGGVVVERRQQFGDCAARTVLDGVDARAPDRKQAGLGPVVEQAVLLLPETQVGRREQVAEIALDGGAQPAFPRGASRLLENRDRRLGVSLEQQRLSPRPLDANTCLGIALVNEHLVQVLGALAVLVWIGAEVLCPEDRAQALGHAPRRVCLGGACGPLSCCTQKRGRAENDDGDHAGARHAT